MPDQPEQPVLVGVDFTADRLRILLTDENGRAVHEGDWPLPALEDEDGWSWEVGGRIAALFAAEGNRRSALALAVAAPGSVETLTGRLLHCSAHEEWNGLAIVDSLRRHINAPIAAENRIVAALLAETWGHPAYESAAPGVEDVVYVTLRGVPAAAILVAGRPARGAHFEAGALPAAPLADDGNYTPEHLEELASVLVGAIALLDSEVVVLDGEPDDLARLGPLLQRVLDEVAPGPQVVLSVLGDRAPLIGAIRLARPLAFEGGRRP